MSEQWSEIPLRLVDTDVHPQPRSAQEMAEYLPEPFRSRRANMGEQPVRPEPNYYYYDLPDFANAKQQRYDATPPSGGIPGTDPDFFFKQLIVDAKVDLAILSALAVPGLLPEVDNLRFMTLNSWITSAWLGEYNKHGRWRGSISVCNRDPVGAAREIERLADHPYVVQIQLAHPYTGWGLGSPAYDPIFKAATHHGLPVAMHVGSAGPFEFTPMAPVGQGSHMLEWYPTGEPLLFASHLMSLIFDGAFERFPELKIVFVEGSFAWALPMIWRMDAYWNACRKDVPSVKRRPSEYVVDHVRFATQPLEDPANLAEYKQFLAWLDPAKLLMFSSDYPHLTFDDPAWAMKRFPESAAQRVMCENAIDFYNLPRTIPKL